jgi:DNA-binding winged helix-turn-helix (wHTH) protein
VRIVLPDGWVDGASGDVHRVAGGPAKLRAKELRLLRYLAERPGIAVGRGELYEVVWGYHPDTRSRTVDTTVRRLRELVEAAPAEPVVLCTEPGVGYRYVAPVDDRDGAAAHVVAGVRDVGPGERVALWGPPGIGRSHWLRATGLPGTDDAEAPTAGLCTVAVRPRVPGVRAIEVTALPDEAARSLVQARLRELGATVQVPDDLSAYDGLPAALLAAADRADLLGRFVEPGPDDPLQQRYTMLAGGDGALGAVAGFGAELPSELVAKVVGEEAVRSWVDRGLVRRVGTVLRVPAHVRRAAAPDPAVVSALEVVFAEAFRRVHDPATGLCTTSSALVRARALAPLVRDPGCRVRRAAVLGGAVPAPVDAEELAPWFLGLHAPTMALDVSGVADPAARRAAEATVRYRFAPREVPAELPPASDTSLGAAFQVFAVAYGHVARGAYEPAQACLADALARVRGHDLLEARFGCRLAHVLVYLGHLDEASALFASLPRSEPGELLEILLGTAMVAALRHDFTGGIAAARAARDLLPRVTSWSAITSGARLSRLFRGAGDLEAAVSTALVAVALLRGADAGPLAEGDLAFALGSALVERGDTGSGRVHLLRALTLTGGRLPQRDAVTRLFLAFADAAEGRDTNAREEAELAVAAMGRDDSRVARMVRLAAHPWVPPGSAVITEAESFADRTFDPELRAVAALAAGHRDAPEVVTERAFSSLVRLLLRVTPVRP